MTLPVSRTVHDTDTPADIEAVYDGHRYTLTVRGPQDFHAVVHLGEGAATELGRWLTDEARKAWGRQRSDRTWHPADPS